MTSLTRVVVLRLNGVDGPFWFRFRDAVIFEGLVVRIDRRLPKRITRMLTQFKID